MAGKLMLAALLPVLMFFSLTVAVSDTHKPAGKKWALLLASAHGWGNYGMQADIFHAYQIAREGGIPEENIIVMAYDELAKMHDNPYPGKIFQSYDLKDVYKGVKVDYAGKTISKKTFMAVLRGDKEAVKKIIGRDGKVVDSGPNDSIFVFISDHGAAGIVAFFDGKDLTAKELNETITSMHERNRYKNMVLYIDTCFSGSMFDGILRPDIGVYAATAANKSSVAFSADCSNPTLGTCLGGLFSINWVYEAESDARALTSMDQQFKEAKIACGTMSTPTQYGDMSIAKLSQSVFLGDNSGFKQKSLLRKVLSPSHARASRSTRGIHVVPKHMIPYYNLKNQLERLPEGSPQAQSTSSKLQAVVSTMSQADHFMKSIATAVDEQYYSDARLDSAKHNFGIINWKCYEPALQAISTWCPGLSQREDIRYYTMAQYGILVNLCNTAPTGRVLSAVREAAGSIPSCQV